jgi:hypothetical protein
VAEAIASADWRSTAGRVSTNGVVINLDAL